MSRKEVLPSAFLLNVDDWLTSPRIAAMTADEERAYFRLLMYQWKNPDCALPDDDAQLAAMAKCPLDLWLNQVRRVVEGCFKGGSTLAQPPPHDGAQKWCNNRLLEDRKRWTDWKEKSRRGGLQSAKKRKKAHRTKVEPRLKQPSTTLSTKAQPNASSSIPPHGKDPIVESNLEIESKGASAAPKNTESRPRDLLFEAVAEVCGVDWDVCTEEQRGEVNQTVGILRKKSRTPAEVRAVADRWYVGDWRGQKGQRPTPSQLRDFWGTAENGGKPARKAVIPG